MGSLVMSQVAPGLGQQHPYHHIMVDRNSDREDDEPASRTPQGPAASERSSSAVPPPPSSPSLQPRASNTVTNTSIPQGSATTARPAPPRPGSSFNTNSVNNHNRGFDQSGFPLSSDPRGLQSSPSSPRLQPTYRSTRSLGGSEATSPSRLRVRDLAHIQSFASQEYLARPRLGRTLTEGGRQYEISSMPVADIIEMVAGLLTRITTTNDRQHEHLHRPIPPPQEQGSLSSHASCVLAFHGKNVPSITILSYLSRIHKYCPTTYEVFLSLLVYFDRMTDNFNRRFLEQATNRSRSGSATDASSHTSSDTLTEHSAANPPRSPMQVDNESSSTSASDLSQYFVVDSYNIHRLVIAGVTCASKFFSDVFYTNSRYAKVGGLPLAELNNLELQFLLLNDFRLSVPVEELEAYGNMLVEFYAREVVAQQQAADVAHQSLHQTTPHGDEMFMQRATTRGVFAQAAATM